MSATDLSNIRYGLWDTASNNWVREWTGTGWQPVVRSTRAEILEENRFCSGYTEVRIYAETELR